MLEEDELQGTDEDSVNMRITARTTGFMELCDPDGSGEVTAKEFGRVFLGRSVRSIILDPKNATAFNPAAQGPDEDVKDSHSQKESVTVVHFGAPTAQAQMRYDDEGDTSLEATFQPENYFFEAKVMLGCAVYKCI